MLHITARHTVIGITCQHLPHKSGLAKKDRLPRAYWGCLTPFPCITGVLAFSLDRNDLVLHPFGLNLHFFKLHKFFVCLSHPVFLVFRLFNRLGGDSVFRFVFLHIRLFSGVFLK